MNLMQQAMPGNRFRLATPLPSLHVTTSMRHLNDVLRDDFASINLVKQVTDSLILQSPIAKVVRALNHEHSRQRTGN
jgi:hypothetical protein